MGNYEPPLAFGGAELGVGWDEAGAGAADGTFAKAAAKLAVVNPFPDSASCRFAVLTPPLMPLTPRTDPNPPPTSPRNLFIAPSPNRWKETNVTTAPYGPCLFFGLCRGGWGCKGRGFRWRAGPRGLCRILRMHPSVPARSGECFCSGCRQQQACPETLYCKHPASRLLANALTNVPRLDAPSKIERVYFFSAIDRRRFTNPSLSSFMFLKKMMG